MKISNKKAVSPVIAVIILIAIILIAAIAIASSIFGLFGLFTYCTYYNSPIQINSITTISHGTYPNDTNWFIFNNKIYLGSILNNGNYPNETYWYNILPYESNGRMINGVCEP